MSAAGDGRGQDPSLSETHNECYALRTQVYFSHNQFEHGTRLLTMIAQKVIAKHNERAGLPLIEHTCRTDGSTPIPSNKIMVFVPGAAQIHQLLQDSLSAR